MSVYADYNSFVSEHGEECRNAGITPRQAMILSMAMLQLHKGVNGGRVSLIIMLPDHSTVEKSDADLATLIDPPLEYLKWGDSDANTFLITDAGVSFIQSHDVIFGELLPAIFQSSQ